MDVLSCHGSSRRWGKSHVGNGAAACASSGRTSWYVSRYLSVIAIVDSSEKDSSHSNVSLFLIIVAKENKGPQEEPKKTEEPKSTPPAAVPAPAAPQQHPTPTPASTPVAQAPTSILPGLDAPSVPISSNAFASGANMNGAQVMTGRSTSRVMHPGGVGGPDSGWKLG